MIALPLDRDRLGDWRGWLPVAAEGALWLLLAVQAVRMALLFLAPAQSPTPSASTRAPVPGDVRIPAIDPFYRQAHAPAGDGAALGYRLFGLRNGADGASAILGKGGKQASYAAGETLAPGVRLASVATDHVWLVANGRRHRLALPALDAVGGGGDAPRTLPAGAAPDRTQAPASGAAAAASRTAKAAPKPPQQTSRNAAATGISAERLLDASGLADAGGLMARLPGGRSALLRVAGLRADDVVLSVDGRPVDPARLASLGRELAGRERVTIQYRRDGRIHTTTLDRPQ